MRIRTLKAGRRTHGLRSLCRIEAPPPGVVDSWRSQRIVAAIAMTARKLRGFLKPSRDAPERFEFGKAALDELALLIEIGVERVFG